MTILVDFLFDKLRGAYGGRVVRTVVLQKRCCEDGIPPGSIPRASFRTESEEFIEEEDQSQHIPFGQPPHLAFSDHVHHLVSLDRPPGPRKRSESLAGVNPSFDRSMILLHDVVQSKDRYGSGTAGRVCPPASVLPGPWDKTRCRRR